MKALKLFSIILTLSWLADLAVPAAAAQAPGRSPIETSAGRPAAPAAAPAAFSKLNPPDGSIQPTNPILRWAYSSGVSNFQYCVSLVDNDITCSWVSTGTSTSWQVSGLSAHTVYYWQVSAFNILSQRTNANAGTWWSFTTGDVPGSFTKLIPGNNSTAEPVILNLTWNSNGSTTDTYEYCLDTTNNNTCDTGWISTGISTGLTIGGLSPSTPYYWQVRAVNSNGETEADGGAWWTFTTGTPATLTVTTDQDSGIGSLRQAIADALPGDIINFDNISEIFLASTLTIDKQVTIDGSGRTIDVSGDTDDDGDGDVQDFSIGVDGMVALNHIFVIDGYSINNGGGIDNFGHLSVTNCNISANISNNAGGGISNETGASLTIANSKILSNSSWTIAGGIENYGSLVLSDSTIFGNSTTKPAGDAGGILNAPNAYAAISRANISHNSSGESGGGINNYGTLMVTGSNFSNNQTTYQISGFGGAISNSSSGSLTVQSSLFVNNSSLNGGAINNFSGGILAVINSTFSGNSAVNGGAFFVESTNTQTITNSTIAGNRASNFTGGIDSLDTVTLRNTIVANNTAPGSANCTGAFFDGGNNLVWGDTTCPGMPADPLLRTLGDNGGPTQTMALSLGSPAIDAANDATCPATDQRGVVRPQGLGCDIGAFELVYYPILLPLVLR